MTAALLACGINPRKSILFQQSQVSLSFRTKKTFIFTLSKENSE
jgi:tryptophanyl-tRNA synthetase